jgi:DNA polymerase III epsilon subunit family exonuclease
VEEICNQLIKFEKNDTDNPYLRAFVIGEPLRKSAYAVVGRIVDAYPEYDLTYFKLCSMQTLGAGIRPAYIELAESYLMDEVADERFVMVAKTLVDYYLSEYEFHKAIGLAKQLVEEFGYHKADLHRAEAYVRIRQMDKAIELLEERIKVLKVERAPDDYIHTEFRKKYEETQNRIATHYIYTPKQNGKEKLEQLLRDEGRYVELTNLPLSDSLEQDSFVAIDFETTGFSPANDAIIDIGAVKVVDGQIVEEFSTLINPRKLIPTNITQLTGITNEMVQDAPLIYDAFPEFLQFIEGCTLLAHNAAFESKFIVRDGLRFGREFKEPLLDTMLISRKVNPTLKSHKLGVLTEHYAIELIDAHRALPDARATAELYLKMREQQANEK